ncbi:acyl carrier protein [Parafannyhessea umbonata]|jgi:acyl carrier protein|uniref:Phosphopantetheine attachment site n=1 Tax=Parafannyhessea umbonata TaxID=604330 RepID=A0A1G6LNT8_9ACTN|nr:acyl carrier protein [Parafannyhessea umbonata]MBM6988233.1 acyl carrier protein [Parafannyhessea umbonata]SDC44784.1 Phosphopantetheine attachment site [Parafannyhessea umbonata]
MDNKELFDKLVGFAKTAYQYKGDITADTPFDELGKESMKMIALTSLIEDELDVEVTIHEVMKMKTFGELVDRVAEEYEE